MPTRSWLQNLCAMIFARLFFSATSHRDQELVQRSKQKNPTLNRAIYFYPDSREMLYVFIFAAKFMVQGAPTLSNFVLVGLSWLARIEISQGLI